MARLRARDVRVITQVSASMEGSTEQRFAYCLEALAEQASVQHQKIGDLAKACQELAFAVRTLTDMAESTNNDLGKLLGPDQGDNDDLPPVTN